MSDKKHIEISHELYDAIQQLKEIFTQMSGKPIENDEDVLSILVSGFIDSVMHEQKGHEGHDEEGDFDEEAAHDHKHGGHHHHGKDDCCGGKGDDCACKHDHKHH